MENNSGSTPPLSSDEALAQLGALAEDRAALADRLITPPWYHPALAGLVFVFIASAASAQWWIIGFTIYCAGLVWLTTAYRRITGMWANGWSLIGGRGYAVALFAVLVAAILVAYAVRSDRLPWWSSLLAACVAALFTAWVGPRFDAACRASLRGSR